MPEASQLTASKVGKLQPAPWARFPVRQLMQTPSSPKKRRARPVNYTQSVHHAHINPRGIEGLPLLVINSDKDTSYAVMLSV